MLIEFVGCSGAGKTTLLNHVVAALRAQGYDAVSSSSMIARTTGTAWVKNPTVRNLLLNILLLPWFVMCLRTRYHACAFALRIIWRDTSSWLDFFNRLRSFMRLLASDRFLRSQQRAQRLIFVDEGTLGCAHNLFVHVHIQPSLHEVCQYFRLIAQPDLVVHVDVPVPLALERTLQRPDPPLKGRQTKQTFETFLRHGYEVFNTLRTITTFRGRLLAVSNVETTSSATRKVVDHILNFILTQACVSS